MYNYVNEQYKSLSFGQSQLSSNKVVPDPESFVGTATKRLRVCSDCIGSEMILYG